MRQAATTRTVSRCSTTWRAPWALSWRYMATNTMRSTRRTSGPSRASSRTVSDFAACQLVGRMGGGKSLGLVNVTMHGGGDDRMRLLILSDLHLELGHHYEVPAGLEYDVVVLAGDIQAPGHK